MEKNNCILYLRLIPLLLNGKNLKEGEKREGEEERIKDLWLSQKEEERRGKNAAYSGDILCGAGICLVLTNADMLGTHTHGYGNTYRA